MDDYRPLSPGRDLDQQPRTILGQVCAPTSGKAGKSVNPLRVQGQDPPAPQPYEGQQGAHQIPPTELSPRQAQDGDPDDPFTKALRGTYNELQTQKTATLASVAELDNADSSEPSKPSSDDVALLDTLPYLTMNLAHAPEQLLRRLFESPRSPTRR
ncbi:hypothetical protein [Saccharopolyspora sp. NPDC002376]